MRLTSIVVASFVLVASLAAGAGCKSRPTEKARQGTLAERVEGSDGLKKVVEALVTSLPKNDTVGKKFAALDWTGFKERMNAYLCKSVGGGCAFTGTQRDALGVELGDDEFVAFMEVFIAAMNETQLPQKEQNDLIDLMMKHREEQAAAPAAAPAEGGAAPAPAGGAAPAPAGALAPGPAAPTPTK
jgi:hemoglobin